MSEVSNNPSQLQCACVHTEATVVISLIVILAGGLLPSTVISAMAGLSPLPLFYED